MDAIEAIRSRRSIRKFRDADIEGESVDIILDAGRWAPSGMNNQPWQFIVVGDRKTIDKIAQCTVYDDIVKSANLLIAVFLDKDEMYDRTKDVMAIGACTQNMLLAAHSLGLGAVWLGEILKEKETVNQILNAPASLELMAVLAIGYIADETSARCPNSMGCGLFPILRIERVVIPAEFQHPAEKATSTRKAISEMVHWERYSRK